MHDDYKLRYENLRDAVFQLYMSAYWTPDRPVINGDMLWTAVRDNAGIPPGMSPRMTKNELP